MALLRRLSAFAEVRRGEGAKTALMFLYFFLLMSSWYVIKPVRNSIFLEDLGPEQLPYVYIATAAIIGLVASAYARLLERHERHLVIIASTLFFCANLVLFRWFFRFEVAWMAALFYLWAAVFSVGAVTQFWSMANEIFNPEEAKRLFGLVGGGGISGGIVGGLLANSLVAPLGTENLLLVSAALLLPCALLAAAVHHQEGRLLREAAPVRRTELAALAAREGTLRAVSASSYLRLLALMMAVMVVVATLVDYGFNAVAAQSFAGKDAKTAFFGVFFAALGALSLLIQFFLTSPILRGLGVGAALSLLPGLLAVASLSAPVLPALWSASALKLADGSLRYSLNQSTREILFLPVPLSQKYAAKAFIDVSLQRWARGGAALLILAAIALGLSWTALALLTAIFCAAWLALVLRARGLYLASLERLLDEPVRLAPRLAEPPERAWPGLSPRAAAALVAAAAPEHLRNLLAAPEAAVRAGALRRLTAVDTGLTRLELERLLGDEDAAVRELAYGVLCAHTETDSCALAERAARLLAAGGEEERVRAAGLLAAVSPLGPEQVTQLTRLLADPSARVRRAAIFAAARSADERLIPPLLALLASPCHGGAASEALGRLGEAVASHAGPLLLGPGCSRPLAERMTQLLASIGGAEVAKVLEAALSRPRLAAPALRALAAMRPPPALSPALVERQFRAALRRSARMLVALGDYEAFRRPVTSPGPPDMLERALLAAQREALEEALLWQGLSRPDRSLTLRSIRGLSHWAKELQAASRELLESGLSREARRLLAIVHSERPAADKAAAAAPLAGMGRRNFLAWVPELLADASAGVRLGAIQALATHPPTGFRAELSRLIDRRGPEAGLAQAAIRHLAAPNPEAGAWT